MLNAQLALIILISIAQNFLIHKIIVQDFHQSEVKIILVKV